MTDDWFAETEKTIKDDRENPRPDAINWKPEPGDILKGTFTNAKVANTKYGKALLVFITSVEGEDYEVWCTRTMLRSQMSDAMPKKDTMIAVQFHGMTSAKREGGKDYNDYTVRCKESNPPAWHLLLDELDAKPAHQQASNTSSEHVAPDFDPF